MQLHITFVKIFKTKDMRYILLGLFLATLSFGTTAQEVTDQQWIHIQKRTADWCPNCGTWGWDFKENLITEFADDNVVIWSAHMGSSSLSTPTSEALVANFGGAGQPVFFVDGGNIFLNSSNGADKLQEVKDTYDGLSLFPAFYGCAAEATYDGEQISVTAKAKFFEATTGTPIHLGLYLLRNETIASQSSLGANALHKNLVIGHFTDDVFGEVLTSEATPAGAEFTVEATMSMPNIDIENYTVVPVLWGFLDGKYAFFNSGKSGISMSTNVKDDYLTEASFKISEVTDFQATANIESVEQVDNAIITVLNTAGQEVASINTSLVTGSNTVAVPFANLTTGMYIMNLRVGKQSVSQQFFMN